MDKKTIFFHKNHSSIDKSTRSSLIKTEKIPSNAKLEDKVIAAIRTVRDPEIPVNIYDLGLIYNIKINHSTEVVVKMTLTAPTCPVGDVLTKQVSDVIKLIEGVSDVKVSLVWEPVWSRDSMSDDIKLSLGLF
ncbi:MAG: iron-sulfur cluster assembly protein [Gammaproteobacteria bacterium]|nr:iron-sulfur cluster assembly protein [Gammaproteobacteria bacterium]